MAKNSSFFYFRGEPVNDHFLDEVKELRYIDFQEFLKLIIQAMRNYRILKTDMKDRF